MEFHALNDKLYLFILSYNIYIVTDKIKCVSRTIE